MLQRVGLAQALLNDPELVILDEPMSGLDPLGRRDVRSLILKLRERGCTVFFSSHVLSDAEALCSRVAILAKGRLAAVGSLDELTAVGSRGWELVIAGVKGDALTRLKPRITKTTPLGDGRFSLELSPSTIPEQLIPELVSSGARIVSLNPLRGTLEDVFVEQVRASGADRFSTKVAS